VNGVCQAATASLFALLAACGGHEAAPVAYRSPEFERFMKAQHDATATPESTKVSRGREVFLKGTCAMCHTVRGTLAHSRVGPDLTHLASRRAIASGTMANTRGNLAGWILNPQNLKPGTKMPPTLLDTADLHSLLAFLETLH